MNREELLKKSRKDMSKEEYEQVKNYGQRLGTIIFLSLTAIIVVFNLFMGKDSYEVQGLFWAFFASLCYSKYYTYRRKATLVALVASVIASASYLSLHVMKLCNLHF